MSTATTCRRALLHPRRRCCTGHAASRERHGGRRALAAGPGPLAGAALADLTSEPFTAAEAARLDKLRLFTIESRIAAELELGHGADLVPELLGLDPGPGLQEIERAVLAGSLAIPITVGSLATVPAASTPEPAAGDPAAERSLIPGERRIAVVVSAALTGLEPLRSATDDRTVELLTDEARRRATAAITELVGSVMDAASADVSGLFGVPAAAENDPARAVRCALRLAAELSELSADVAGSWSVPAPSPRIAVCSVEVEPGSDEPLPSSVDRRCAELAAAGPPGAAVVADDVRQLIEPLFQWGERVPDRAASVAASSRASPSRVQGLPGMAAPLLGRKDSLARASGWLGALLQGRGGVLFVVGEAGIGKTRLLDELRNSARTAAPEPLWLGAGCEPHGERVPYGPFRQLVRGWLGSTPLDRELRIRVAAQRQLEGLAGVDAATVLPVLFFLAGVSRREAGGAQIAELDPELLQRNIAAALTALLVAVAAERPVVVAVDDLHWADQPSLELLEHLLEVPAAAPVALLLAARPDPDHRWWGVRETAMRRFPHRSREVVLEPLRDGVDTQLLRALVGDATLPPDVERQIVEVADGNPFFLEEIVRSLVTSGLLETDVDRWRLRGQAAVDIPPSVERIIVSRLDVLPASHRAVLGAASILGRVVRVPLLARISAQESHVDFDGILESLLRTAWLAELRRWPTHELRFNHALTAEAVYRNLTGKRRAQLHERAARAVEAVVPDGDSAAFPVLARHWEQAGDIATAAGYHRLAGDHALQVHALELARREFEGGLELSERAMLPAVTVAALTCGLGSTLRQSGQGNDARPVLLRAEALAAAAGAPTIRLAALEGLGVLAETNQSQTLAIGYFQRAAELAAQLGDTTREISLHNRLVVVAASQLRFSDAHTSARRALQIADLLGDPRQSARAIDGAKMIAWYLGDLNELERLAAGAEPDLRADGEWYLQFLLIEWASVPAARGQWDQAMTRIEEGLALNDRIGNRAERPLLLALAARLNRWRGQLGTALQMCSDATELARQVGADWMLSWAQTERGALLNELGAPDQAITDLEDGRRIARACHSTTVELWSTGHLCLATHLTGDDRATPRSP